MSFNRSVSSFAIGFDQGACFCPESSPELQAQRPDCRIDVAARLPSQETGEFHLIRDGNVTSLRAAPAVMATEQLPEHEILELARRTQL